ncbi:hypothetical protein APHAL10511_005673 [Amanita phalloides]|nr:hypothetical protein APHAL10511_005673 [Amanita phalloides]
MTFGADFLEVAIGRISNRKVEIALTLVIVFLLGRTIRYYQGLQVINNYPGLRVGFDPLSLVGNLLLPRTWWNPKVYGFWFERATMYKQFGTDTISIVPFFSGSPMFYTRNVEVTRQIVSNGPRASFIKPLIGGNFFAYWGMNVFSANGETWRRHRRIVAPSFNNALYEHVFDESIVTYRDMIASEKWVNKREMNIPVFQELVYKFALLVIMKCGFGVPFSWSTPPEANDGSTSLQQALQLITDNFILVIYGNWLLRLPLPKFRAIRAACQQTKNFMKTQVEQRRALIQNSRGVELAKDVFTTLVQANEDEGAKYKLNNDELVGNVFIMLIAGHETTARSLAATIAFLAWDQDTQDDVAEQIKSVVGYDRDPNFQDYPKLNKVLSAFLEAIRMFPPSSLSIRESAEDTVLKIPNPAGQEGYTTIPIQKGTMVVSDTIGHQYDPKYYDEPEKYKPLRWYDTENLESERFTGFSVGSRVCIGRKFATVEAVAFLTMLLRDWRVEPFLRHGENKEQWRERVFDPQFTITLGIKDASVSFIRRQH